MVVTILTFLAGILLVLKGADLLVDASSNIARRFHLSEFVIGVTIVGIGTSMPELAVSTFAAIAGNAEITVGNVTGSNICNVLLILGVTALIAPVALTKENIRKDIPYGIAASLILLIFVFCGKSSNTISRIEGSSFILLFVTYLLQMFKGNSTEKESFSEAEGKLFKDICFVVLGLAGLIVGGKLFVNSATSLAKAIGVSDAVIAVTLVAFGTSLPELATSAIAAAKGKGQLALGNVIGSNIANILLIVGIGSCIIPLKVDGSVAVLSVLATLATSIMLFLPLLTNRNRKAIGRIEGIVFLIAYVAYIYATLVL